MARKQNTSPNPGQLQLRLTEYRQKAGIALEQIAETTKISMRFLQAIEAEEFDKLPGGIFAKSYVRQYAAVIGFDEEKLLANYQRRTSHAELDLSDWSPAGATSNGKERRSAFNWFRVLSPIKRL